MNNSKLGLQSISIFTMASGLRDDAWHWRGKDVTDFSSEKLRNILTISHMAQSKEDREALLQVRLELERRAADLL